MDTTVTTYLAYLAVAIPLTVWVASTLSSNGRVFLVDVFAGNDDLADAVNKLLVVGFYLVNLGFVTLYLRVDEVIADSRTVFEVLSVKLGVVMLTLGVLHFLNVYVFNVIRRRHRLEQLRTPPLPPQAFVPSGAPHAQGQPYPQAR
jgi:hypothetical protein